MQGEGTRIAGDRYLHGQTIADKYRLVRRLDEGGMGTVWVAHNVDLDVSVALKLIRSELGAAAAERLVNEARILARLEHPSIVRVFDSGRTEQGDPFIAMELLAGECLADTLARVERLEATRAVQVLLSIVDGVALAHERGIVHRDIKPENIFLATGDGRLQPKILDFGIARTSDGSMRLTRDGTVLGSPAYMSPEQARGGDVDARSDVWALSVVLYEVISGRTPFEAENYNATLRAIIEDEPPSLVDLGATDALLAAVIERGLVKDREQRFQSMREIGTALAQWLWSQGIEEDAARTSLRTTWLGRGSDAGDAPLSIPPVTLPESVPPERPSRPLPSWIHVTPAEPPRLSTGGVSITSNDTRSSRSRRWPLIAAALASVVVAGGVLLWQSSSATPAAVETGAPSAPTEPERAVIPAPEPAPVRVVAPEPTTTPDAGAERAVRRKPKRAAAASELKIPY